MGADAILERLDQLLIERATPSRPANDGASEWRPGCNYQWSLKDKNVRGSLFPGFDHDEIMERSDRIAKAVGVDIKPRIYSCGSKVALLTQRQVSASTLFRSFVRNGFA